MNKGCFLQLISEEEELRANMDELLAVIQEQGSGDLAVKFKSIVARQTESIHQDIKTASLELDKLNDLDQKELSPEEVEDLTRTVSAFNAYLDVLHVAAYENMERKKALDLDFADNMEELKTFLQKRAELLVGHVELTWRSITYMEDRINRVPPTDTGGRVDVLQSELFVLEEKQRVATDSLTTTVDLMDEVGLETSKYRLILIKVTGNVSDHIFDQQVVQGLMAKLYDSALGWFSDNGPAILLNLIVVLLILLVFKVVAGLAGRVVRKALDKSQLELSNLLKDFFVSMASKAVMFIGLLAILSQFGVEIGPALAGLGVVGFIVGFALQETLSNFASGLMILIYRPFDVGDLVEVAGTTGRVRLMSLVSTTIVTLDNQRLVVPNTKIWGGCYPQCDSGG